LRRRWDIRTKTSKWGWDKGGSKEVPNQRLYHGDNRRKTIKNSPERATKSQAGVAAKNPFRVKKEQLWRISMGISMKTPTRIIWGVFPEKGGTNLKKIESPKAYGNGGSQTKENHHHQLLKPT